MGLPPRQNPREKTSVDNGSERPISKAMHRPKKELHGNCRQPLAESRLLIGGILFGMLALCVYASASWYQRTIVSLNNAASHAGDLQRDKTRRLSDPRAKDSSDVQLMTWGGGNMVSEVGKNLYVIGSDLDGVLHIRVFNAYGNRTSDTDEKQLPRQARNAIGELKQQVKKLSPPHMLTHEEKSAIVDAVKTIVNTPQSPPEVGR